MGGRDSRGFPSSGTNVLEGVRVPPSLQPQRVLIVVRAAQAPPFNSILYRLLDTLREPLMNFHAVLSWPVRPTRVVHIE